MRVLVYPHSMEIGGSQLNAVELAAAVRDRGHEVVVLGEPGPLVATVASLGLEHVAVPLERSRPSPSVLRQLLQLVRTRGFDVVHGYEWPPAIEAFYGPRLRLGTPAVCTVMSMSVAPFLPRIMPLVVGTDDLRRRAEAAGHRHVTLLEPPVDVRANAPDQDGTAFRAAHGFDPAVPLVVVVSRLARELKQEGLLAACAAVGSLVRDGVPVRLAVVGDGPARADLEAAAAQANAVAGERAVVLTGALDDPRPAYAAADVTLGMGSSALRAMAFGKPLVVQGEHGFWRLLTPETAGTFLRQGWYGIGDGSQSGVSALRVALRVLLDDPGLRAELGQYGRELVIQRFSLDRAGQIQEGVYSDALATRTPDLLLAADATRAAAGVAAYKARRKYQRLRGRAPSDDFNSLRSMISQYRRRQPAERQPSC